MSTALPVQATSPAASRTPLSGFFDAWVRPVKAHHWLIVTAPDRPRVRARKAMREWAMGSASRTVEGQPHDGMVEEGGGWLAPIFVQ